MISDTALSFDEIGLTSNQDGWKHLTGVDCVKSAIKVSLIAARAKTGVIGNKGQLPWRLADDLAFFKSVTVGHPIIMGRRTWESLPRRPLPGRDNIVLSRDWTFSADGARVFSAIGPAVEAGKALAVAAGKREVFIIGGDALYASTIGLADVIYLTEVDADIEGDAVFPSFDESKFDALIARKVEADERNDYAFQVRILKRKVATKG
ncbi:MAG: dihydrofolate reductase [Henriciella sp.]